MCRFSAVVFLLLVPLLASSSDPTAATASDATNDLLKPFGAQGPISEIDTVDGFLSPHEFLPNYVMKNRPLLFKGAAKVSPAFEQWTDAYLSEKTPPRPAGDVHIEHNKKENRTDRHSYVHFKEFLRIYNTSDIYMVSQVPNFLIEDLVVPFSLQCRYFVLGGLDTNVAWFSNGGTSSVIHNDSYENINCLLRGRKSLVFLNTTRYQGQVKKIIDRPEGGYSSANVDKIDLKARPEFSGLTFQSAEMEAGDCLYIPNLWIHQVRSFENNLAVNLWWFQRANYDLTGCTKIFDHNLRFSRVRFGGHLRAASEEVDEVRSIMASHLNPPTTESDFLSFLSNGDAAGISANWPQFPVAVAALFKSLDIDQDGRLTEEELESKMKLKVAAAAKEAIINYNVQVFAMDESAVESAADAIGKLPKLFEIGGSDASVYALHRTWQQADGKEGASDEEEKEEVSKDEL